MKTITLKNSYWLVLLAFLPLLIKGQTAPHERINLGLYGGASLDFAFDTNHRLFSAVTSPGTLFYSDDTCKTWTQAFPIDSLEYAGMQRGWSGGRRVLTNQTGWVAVQTQEAGGTLSSTVVSYNDGDSGTFQTAFDHFLLKKIVPSAGMASPTAIDLTDHWLYVAMDKYLLRTNDTALLGPHNVVLVMDTVSLADTSWHIRWISAANTVSGFPLFLVVTADDDDYGRLLKYDGTSFTETAHPVSTFDYYFKKIFSHPADTSMDTLVVSCKEPNINLIKVFRSLDGGANWTDITPSAGTRWPLQNADYSPYWASFMPKSNGWRLSFPGGAFSVDLGATWTNNFMEDNATAAHPRNPDIVVASKNKGPQVSLDGGATFTNPYNEGHAAVSITKIAQLRRNTYYVATKAGLGYTVAYHDSTVKSVDKWRSPYGDFPISGIGGDAGFSAVDIDPADSLHVIAGCDQGFYVTTTGPGGFTLVQPSDWETGTHRDYRVNDIQFITSDTVVAVTGTGSNVLPSLLFDYGNIWLSTDGGLTWTKSHPSDGGVDFEQGNSVVVAYGKTDTAVYIGCGYWDHHFPKVAGQLWKSTDFGATWHFVNAGPHSQAAGSAVDSMPIYDLDVYPGTIDTLYLASGQNLDFAFAKTTDGGSSYTYLNLMMPEGAFAAVMVHPDNPDLVSVSARRDLWLYDDVTGTAILSFEGLPGEFVPDLEYGSTIMGTNTGLYKLTGEAGNMPVTVWNGDGFWSEASRWSKGVPSSASRAVVESGNLTLDVDGEAAGITIMPGAGLKIEKGKTMHVNGDLFLLSDSTGDASLVNNGTLSVAGNTEIQKYVPAGKWHLIAPPTEDSTAVFYGLKTNMWDEKTGMWVPLSSQNRPVQAGEGFAVQSAMETVLHYHGLPRSSGFSPMVSLSGSKPEKDGWNLVGNAFTAAIDWNSPYLVKNNLDNTVYFWDGTQYLVYNGTVRVGSGGVSSLIPGQEGFFVHAYGNMPRLVVPPEALAGNAPEKTGDVAGEKENLLRLQIEGNGYRDETMILFDSLATNGFDHAYDAYKRPGIEEAPMLYSMQDNDLLALNVQPFDGPVDSVMVGVGSNTPGSFTLRAVNLSSFSKEMTITLEDVETGEVTDLRKDSVVVFQVSSQTYGLRFKVRFQTGTTGIGPHATVNSNLKVFVGENAILYLKQTRGKPLYGRINIYDVMGRLQKEFVLNGNPAQQFRLSLPAGVYVVRVVSDRSGYLVKKIKLW